MNKKIIYTILVLVIAVVAVLIPTISTKFNIAYNENTKIYIYIGKKFENNDLKEIIKEVFETGKVEIQKVEVYEDMACVTILKQENASEQKETLKNKINEKFEIEITNEDIEFINQPKTDMYSMLKPYIWPVIISTVIILIYAIIMCKHTNKK